MEVLRRRRNDILVESSPTSSFKSGGGGGGGGGRGGIFPINDLTEALLSEILIRLPAKSAHQCKSVCKRWNSLISEPYFAPHFMRHNKSSSSSSSSLLPSLIFSYSKGVCKSSDNEMFKSRDFLLSFLPCFRPDPPMDPRVFGSSGGLLLCCPTLYNQRDYYVCNPVTMSWIQLPPPPRLHEEVHIGFICEPYCQEELKFRFIVVIIPMVDEELNSFEMEIFSSQTGEWSVTEVLCPHRFHVGPTRMTAFVHNGILHFLSPGSSIFAYIPFHNGTDEPFRFIDLPADVDSNKELCLGTSQGSLRLSQWPLLLVNGQQSSTLMVWDLTDYNAGNWSLAHQVNLRRMVSRSRRVIDRLTPDHCSMKVIGFDSNDGDVVYMWFSQSTIALCNMRRLTMRKVSGTLNLVYPSSYLVFPLELPCWPTPVPSLPQHAAHA